MGRRGLSPWTLGRSPEACLGSTLRACAASEGLWSSTPTPTSQSAAVRHTPAPPRHRPHKWQVCFLTLSPCPAHPGNGRPTVPLGPGPQRCSETHHTSPSHPQPQLPLAETIKAQLRLHCLPQAAEEGLCSPTKPPLPPRSVPASLLCPHPDLSWFLSAWRSHCPRGLILSTIPHPAFPTDVFAPPPVLKVRILKGKICV